MDNYLSFLNNRWSIGVNLEDGQILFLDGECSLPTTEGCSAIWRDKLDKVLKVKVETKPKLTHQEYYQVKADGIYPSWKDNLTS